MIIKINRITQFSTKILQFSISEGCFWIRLFGFGFTAYSTSYFSDRYFKRRKYFGYHIKFLKP